MYFLQESYKYMQKIQFLECPLYEINEYAFNSSIDKGKVPAFILVHDDKYSDFFIACHHQEPE